VASDRFVITADFLITCALVDPVIGSQSDDPAKHILANGVPGIMLGRTRGKHARPKDGCIILTGFL
jgi:hypothetical protein